MCLAARGGRAHTAVTEIRRAGQRLRRRFPVHQLAAEGGGKHISRAVHRPRKARLENFRILPIEARAVADLLAAVNARDDDIFYGELCKDVPLVRVHRAAGKERRLRAVGCDELRCLAEHAHPLHMLSEKQP